MCLWRNEFLLENGVLKMKSSPAYSCSEFRTIEMLHRPEIERKTTSVLCAIYCMRLQCIMSIHDFRNFRGIRISRSIIVIGVRHRHFNEICNAFFVPASHVIIIGPRVFLKNIQKNVL